MMLVRADPPHPFTRISPGNSGSSLSSRHFRKEAVRLELFTGYEQVSKGPANLLSSFSLKDFACWATFISVEASEGDAEIVALLARGEQEAAFTRLFRAHWTKVVQLGYRLTRDPIEASDIAQETFVLVHRGLAGYRGLGCITAWLMKIALHVALKERARRKRSRTIGIEALATLPARVEPERLPNERVERAMAGLPDDQRAVLSLFAVEGLKHAEIAEALGVPEGTVWSRLHHARRRLEELLGNRQ